jgi:hypothetical protein
MIDPVRQELLQVLAEFSEAVPEVRLGQLMANRSYLARGLSSETIWNMEDEELLAAALRPDRRVRGRCQPTQEHRGQGRRAGLGHRIAIERDLLGGIPHSSAEVVAVDHRQPIADDQSQPEKHRQPGIAQVALHPLRHFQEAVLKHVERIDPTIKPRIHAQLDHPPQAVAVPLEQVGQRPAIPGSKPLEQADGFARWVVRDLAHTL